jgi:hypothetical protein
MPNSKPAARQPIITCHCPPEARGKLLDVPLSAGHPMRLLLPMANTAERIRYKSPPPRRWARRRATIPS